MGQGVTTQGDASVFKKLEIMKKDFYLSIKNSYFKKLKEISDENI